ncbi:MAG: DUF6351 family protein [Motiliproteus sp.]
MAPAVDNLLLDVGQHISLVPRPPETFDFPIALGGTGPDESLYSGPNQYPFYCMTLDGNLGQPLVDNQQGYGVPVYRSIKLRSEIIGYSKDCSLKTTLSYYRIDEQERIRRVDDELVADLLAMSQFDGRLFSVEQGTINRFIYTLIVPVDPSNVGRRVVSKAWNKRLIYQFNGGSGLGFRQGRQLAAKVMERQIQQLLDGYAIISSSGNRTSYTYNMLLAEDTARRVKRQFISLYGEPLYTVGIGGSGGGLAQYLIGQNSQGILDGLIPLYSYPDMITQATYALDCDLLNNYFTFRAANRRDWKDWRKRQLVEGMNALNDFPQRIPYLQPVNQLMAGFVPSLPRGNSECINGYFGLSSFLNNPRQGFLRDFFHRDVVSKVNWSYWQDMVSVLGEDNRGFALSTWDNVGVQYGLSALLDEKISVAEFIDINQKIGSWKPPHQMKKESIATPLGRKVPLWLSLWGNHNIAEVSGRVARRSSGSIEAMHAAYRSGQVFIGRVSLPIIDVRHYLEEDLDMHHVSASFYSRLRLLAANGHADNHVIWIAHKNFSPVNEAFRQMDRWQLNLNQDPLANVVEARPEGLIDGCFAEDGSVIEQGDGVWDGRWNGRAGGGCSQHYPIYSNSRIGAGGPWAGDLFKCQLIPISQAIAEGVYGEQDMKPSRSALQQIFPDGVCDYSQPDAGRPEGLVPVAEIFRHSDKKAIRQAAL